MFFGSLQGPASQSAVKAAGIVKLQPGVVCRWGRSVGSAGGGLHACYEQPYDLAQGVEWVKVGVLWEHPGEYMVHDNSTQALALRRSSRKQLVPDAECTRIYFDGGWRKASGGAGGYVVFAQDGQCIAGEGFYWGSECNTNNLAEGRAM